MAENMDFSYLPQSYHRLTFKTYFSAFRKIVWYKMSIYVCVWKEARKVFFFIEITPRLPLTPGLPSSKVFFFLNDPDKIRRMIKATFHKYYFWKLYIVFAGRWVFKLLPRCHWPRRHYHKLWEMGDFVAKQSPSMEEYINPSETRTFQQQ